MQESMHEDMEYSVFFRIIHSMSACTKLSIVAYHNIRVYISNIIL